jgi:poly [ADP-ribose] polymerase
LNQSNLQKNNNKFYIIQLLESDDKKTYYTFNRWGRVGYKGQLNSWSFDDPLDAVHDFTKKLREKKGRGYVEIDINYDDETDKKDASDEEDKKKKPAPKGKGKKKEESEDEEEEEDTKKKATPKKADKKEDKEEEKKEVVKKVITKGGAAVDEYFDEKDCEVYMANGKVYAKTLNQSNLGHNNNKFYIIQILESTKNKGTFFVWNRWGRVGVKGQTMKKKVNSAAAAIEDFDKKFYDKTVKGDYVEIEINYDDENSGDKKDEEEKEDKGDAKSKLPEQVKDLVKLIFDLKMMNNQMKEIGYDPSRMPLGKLSKNAIQKGYEVLKQLADAIEKKRSKDVLSQLSSQFYSQIPHDFGFKPMANFILDTDKKVKEKLEMLASLEDIQIATKLLDEGKNSSEDSLIDSNYQKLKCGLTPCPSNSDEFKMVLDYIKNTHAATHSSYSLELIDLFAVEREGEAERYTKDIHNKQLLWHGSRLTNYVGILSQGLRIAPPEAPVTGYMFGKGVYFADMVSKSANYCFTNPQNNTGIMLLCEVALGNCNEKLHADYHAANLPPGKHSTKGCGRTAPSANGTKTVDGDVAVPMGKGENVNLQGGALLYNEFIVYDIKQIKIRYLLKLKFNYRYNY